MTPYVTLRTPFGPVRFRVNTEARDYESVLVREEETMTETEQNRLNDAKVLAKSAPEKQHVPFRWRDNDPPHVQSCVKCGGMMPRGGYTTPCRGWARIALR